jgi:hypothetical protein
MFSSKFQSSNLIDYKTESYQVINTYHNIYDAIIRFNFTKKSEK